MLIVYLEKDYWGKVQFDIVTHIIIDLKCPEYY